MSTPTIKYRAACDHCSATKIKCTQERPQCARCRTLGRDCHYSRSLRAGKPPRSSQGLNRKISNTPVLPRRAPVHEPPQPANNGPLSHGLPTQTTYSAMSPTNKPDPAWSANASPYPTPPAGTLYNGPEVSFFPDLQAPNDSAANTPMDPEWFFDFNNAALPSESPAPPRIDSREPTQQPSPVSEGKQTSCTPQATHMYIRPQPEQLGHIPPNTPITLYPGIEGDQCLRIATETLNRLYELPSLQVDAETKQFSIDQVLSNTARAVQICHDLITCPCAKDFYLPIVIAIIASKVLSWYQAVAYIRDSSTEVPRPEGNRKQAMKEMVVDGQLALGAYKLDEKMGWVLKNHIVLGQLQSLNEIVHRYDAQFCSESVINQMAEGGKVYAIMSGLLTSRLQSTIQEIEGRLRASSS